MNSQAVSGQDGSEQQQELVMLGRALVDDIKSGVRSVSSSIKLDFKLRVQGQDIILMVSALNLGNSTETDVKGFVREFIEHSLAEPKMLSRRVVWAFEVNLSEMKG